MEEGYDDISEEEMQEAQSVALDTDGKVLSTDLSESVVLVHNNKSSSSGAGNSVPPTPAAAAGSVQQPFAARAEASANQIRAPTQASMQSSHQQPPATAKQSSMDYKAAVMKTAPARPPAQAAGKPSRDSQRQLSPPFASFKIGSLTIQGLVPLRDGES